MNLSSESDSLPSTEKKHGDNDVVVVGVGGGSVSGGNYNADHRTVEQDLLHSKDLLFLSQFVSSISLFNMVTSPQQVRTFRY